MQHASDNWATAIFVAIVSLIIVLKVVMAQRGIVPTIRRIAGLNAIDEAVGRATEMGRPVLMVPGIWPISIPTLQAMNIFGHIAKSVATYGNHTIMPVCDASVVGIGEEVLRDAYTSAGRPELFSSDDVRFLSDQQFAFASGVAGIIEREKPAASFLMGAFFAESLILAETGQRAGAIQVAATPQTTQLPFFIAACDYVLLGDEFYAASAYLSRNPTLLGSIVGQDYAKVVFIIAIVIGTVCATVLGAQGIDVKHMGDLHSPWRTFIDFFVK
ncbi:MAG TPA: DUF6754 domain-containing protein [Capsulimonadaceae bacterium]